MKIKLGSKVKDPITGLTGIAVACSTWLWGCNRIAVQPPEMKDGKPVEESWFDENRLEVIEEKSEPKRPSTGGPNRESRSVREG